MAATKHKVIRILICTYMDRFNEMLYAFFIVVSEFMYLFWGQKINILFLFLELMSMAFCRHEQIVKPPYQMSHAVLLSKFDKFTDNLQWADSH